MKRFLLLLCCLAMATGLFACSNAPQTSLAPQVSQEKTEPAAPKTQEQLPTIGQTAEQPAPTEEPSAPTEEQPAPTEEQGPLFESEALTVYSESFRKDLKKLHKAVNGVLYAETTDGGFYHIFDHERSNNLLAKEGIVSWGYAEFTGLVTVDANGYYSIDDHIAHGINGDILYAFFNGKLYVYSVDAEGYVYLNTFESTGKKVDDNVKLSFEEKEQDGYSFNHLGVYDKVEEIRVLPAKGNFISSPKVLVKVNGHTYVENIFLVIVQNKVSLVTNGALSADEAEHMLDYYTSSTYYKDGVVDKLFYLYDGDEYVLNLPDGHTLDQLVYFNRGVNDDMMLFDNGDVYTWKGQASILGETPEKNEALTQVGNEIVEIIYCTNTYRVLMSDGVIYTVE